MCRKYIVKTEKKKMFPIGNEDPKTEGRDRVHTLEDATQPPCELSAK